MPASILIHQIKNFFGSEKHKGIRLTGDKITNKLPVIAIFALSTTGMQILLIDNYDSFTWNLHQLLLKAGAKRIVVLKNDMVLPEHIAVADSLVFSPGPGLPSEAGLMKEIIRTYAGSKKILGICLGHQAIAEVFGAGLLQADEIFHGTATPLRILEQKFLFNTIPENVCVGRYHSWVVDTVDFPRELLITATDHKGVIMALRHKTMDITGVQFHPESILTPAGEKMMRNWICS
jgi:anthranilate synthase component 2